MKIHEHLRQLRDINGYKQIDVAKGIGATQSNYAKIENGKTELTFKKLLKLAGFYNVTIQELINVPFSRSNTAEKTEHVKTLEKLYATLLEKDNVIIETLQKQLATQEKLNESLKIKFNNLSEKYDALKIKNSH